MNAARATAAASSSPLTDEGRTVLNKRRRRWLKRWEAAMGEVSERDLEAAADVMRRIGALLDEL